MDYQVRLATPKDADAIMGLLALMHEENGLFEMDYDAVRDMVDNVLSGKNGIIGVIDGEEGLEAAVCLVIDKLWYSKTWCLNDVFNFVAPPYRRSTRAKSLITFAKNYSDNVGIPLLMGIVSNVRTEAKIKLLERQLKKAGAFFVYNCGEETHENHAQ